MLVVRAVDLVGAVVAAPLDAPARTLLIVGPEEELGVAPSVGSEDLAVDVRLEKGVVDPLDLGEVHVDGISELVPVFCFSE